MSKILEVNITYKYTIEINEEDPIVQEYESENLLLLDIATYRFSSVLPVIAEKGVIVKDYELIEVS